MNISNVFQFILGFLLGVFLLMVGSVGAAYYFFNRMAATPPKPVFSSEAIAPPEPAPTPEPEPQATEPDLAPIIAEPEAIAEETPEEEEEAAAEDTELPPGAYAATVTWSDGLSLRAEPSLESARIGGINFNTQVTVLGTNDDGSWQQIRLEDGTEAWVRAGNLRQAN
ncbi:hypothetical protein NIES970_10040 [[Synechococcus] sp. NIES-970]|uniref:SH3 domain-containing protein n=1 Tax=Picosynechococcus sp. NKBG15041c TaxID=1407650 RepID=UPI0003F77763|nr:SH3 domain-containing protein [Picosynechococcus sp. NKBG15041c]BAW96083.1 hypothetical protein NIES970_10040 [[Synechococcus] sp. NIES-970]